MPDLTNVGHHTVVEGESFAVTRAAVAGAANYISHPHNLFSGQVV